VVEYEPLPEPDVETEADLVEEELMLVEEIK